MLAELSSERVFDGKVFDVDRDRVRMPNGREVTVDIVRHPQSVVLLPVPEPGHIDPDPAVSLCGERLAVGAAGRQRRPGGRAGAGGAARVPRGDRAGSRRRSSGSAALYPDAGLLRRGDGVLPAVGPDGRRARPPSVDEDEDIEARTFTLAEARDMVRRGEIVDMKTVVGTGDDLDLRVMPEAKLPDRAVTARGFAFRRRL